MSAVSDAIDAILSYQATLSAMTMLSLTNYRFPTHTKTSNLRSSYDFIVVGGGTAGSVVARRLTENENFTVLLIEAGPVSPMECLLPGLFTVQPNSQCDWNQTSTNDEFSSQNIVGKRSEMTAGKMLGGSSCLEHMIHNRGNEYDYSIWKEIIGDDSWSYKNLLPYFIKSESVHDEIILKDYSEFHGTQGPLNLTKQPSDSVVPILNAFQEQGHKLISDITANETLGYTLPLLNIAGTYRQSASVAYLSPIKNRQNLHVMYNTQVIKIIFNDENEATGVIAINDEGENITAVADKEVIVSAGAVNTAKLLILSGIGPKDQLESLGIPIISDLPVGRKVLDQVGTILAYSMGETTKQTVSNPHEFPAPMTTGFIGLDSEDYPTYMSVPILFPQSSQGFLQLCAWVFKYASSICEAIYNVNLKKEILYVGIILLHPESFGHLQLVSTDPSVPMNVTLGHLSNETDITKLGLSLMNFNSVLNTTYFSNLNSTFIKLDMIKCNDFNDDSLEYWLCYGKAMSTTMFHYHGSCPMGTVLNSNLTVINVKRLRVIDASAMPASVSGKIKGAVYVIAEKGCDDIKNTYG